ncbi:MAG: hypothetical protein ABSH01_02305 [Terriglobia bacterium]|jgi:hypothetical protein
MSSEKEKAALGDILDRYNEANRHLIALQAEADKLAGKFSELAELLRHGPPYPILPATGFLDPLRIEKLFKVLHDTYEQKTVMGQRLRDLE